MIAGGSYGERTYAEITIKLEEISQNNKACSTWIMAETLSQCKLHITHLKIRFVKRWLQLELSLGWCKKMSPGCRKVNAVNYLAKPLPPVNEYEEDCYPVIE